MSQILQKLLMGCTCQDQKKTQKKRKNEKQGEYFDMYKYFVFKNYCHRFYKNYLCVVHVKIKKTQKKTKKRKTGGVL